MTVGVSRGWWEGNTLVIQDKLERLGQSGHILVPRHHQRSGCGLLFPKKSCHTLSDVATARVICLVPAHALVSCPCHLVTQTFLFNLACTLLLFCPLNTFSLSPVLVGAHVTLSTPLLLFTFSESASNVSNFYLFQRWASITNSISLSVRL